MGSRGWVGLAVWALAAAPATAGTVAIEDHGLLEAGRWQINSILCVSPNVQQVEGVRVSALAPEASSLLTQFSQEFRYGLTDRLMIRTTVPMALLRDGAGQTLGGLGDWEAFVKASLWSHEESPWSASAGLQVIAPTSMAAEFSLNGGLNLVPCLMLNAGVGPGDLTASLAYARALGYRVEGRFFHPSDSVVYALGYSVTLAEPLCVSLEVLGSETLPEHLDGVAAPSSIRRQISCGPGVTWNFDAGNAMLLSLQLPVWREGTFAESQPVNGLVQYSRTF